MKDSRSVKFYSCISISQRFTFGVPVWLGITSEKSTGQVSCVPELHTVALSFAVSGPRCLDSLPSALTSLLLSLSLRQFCCQLRTVLCHCASTYERIGASAIFKPQPPVGAGGGYMFSGRACVRPSVIHVVVLCFRDISSICWRIFAKLLSLVHLGTEMTWLRFWFKRSKFKVTPSWRRRTALDATVECKFF